MFNLSSDAWLFLLQVIITIITITANTSLEVSVPSTLHTYILTGCHPCEWYS